MKMGIYGAGYNNRMLVGVDAYGRSVCASSGERENRKVGIFFFLWLGFPMATDIYDVGAILAQHGKDVLFHRADDIISPDGQAHWWGEPLWGYYNSADEWVIRRQMEMLTDAGVDFLVFDTTNTLLYEHVARKVMQVIAELRMQGWNAPQVAFYTHSRSIQTIETIYKIFYAPNVYPESWFRIDGKPLIIGYTRAEQDLAEACSRGDTAYRPADLRPELQDFFHVREARWPNDPVGENTFPYTEWVYPQPRNGNMVSVSVASHVMVPFSFSLTRENWKNWGRGYDVHSGENVAEDVDRGTFFQSEWDTAIESDPELVFVTGWNEWVAYKQWYAGEYMLCDNVDRTYSRDTEPMRGGYGDAFYIQLMQNIRRYKCRPLAPGDAPSHVRKTVDLDGPDAQWDDVDAVYRRVGCANVRRDADGGARTVHYEQEPAVNNLLSVRVTHDRDTLYFRIEASEDIVLSDAANWMNLYIGTGACARKGWEGYEYAVNRARERVVLRENGATAGAAVIERLAPDGSGTRCAEAAYTVRGRVMQYAVPRAAVGLAPHDTDHAGSDIDHARSAEDRTGSCDFYFKVADGVADPGDILCYYTSGRSLPMGRLSYFYRIADCDAARNAACDVHGNTKPERTE